MSAVSVQDQDLAALIDALTRENRILRAQLERSERTRTRLEEAKDEDQMTLLRAIAELREAQAEVERSNVVLEHRVAARTLELSRSNEALTRARDGALAATRAKSSFLAVMSHELRTPLNAIMGYTEIVLDDVGEHGDSELDRESMGRDLTKIMGSARHLLSIIDDLLDVSQIEAGAVALHLEPTLLRPMIREVEQMIRPLARKHGNAFKVELEAAPAEVVTDRTRLRQILLNLLGNAAKFTQDGELALTVEEVGQDLRLTIRDTGVGIPAEALERLFDPFIQFDGSPTRRAGGSGLGLTLSRSFCHLLGGDIEVTSEVGVGSTFIVTLPRCPPRQPVLASIEAGMEPPVRRPHGRPALVLDDDPDSRATIEKVLRDAGFEPAVFADVDAALAYLGEHRPALAMVDVLREDQRGFMAVRTLAGQCPTLVLSSIDAEQRCRELGAAGFLLRPTTAAAIRLQIARFVPPS